ncbi:hypothetical protein ACWCQL_30990 [Streptomyces sp. NPDC002073]
MRFPKAVVGVCLAGLVLSGCGGSDGTPQGVEKTIENDETVSAVGVEPRILVHRQALAPGVAVAGKLEYLPGGKCLVARGKRAESDYVAAVVWPKGVEPVVLDSRHGVNVPGFGSVLAGDGIKAGGAFWKPDDPRVEQAVRGLAPACLPEGGFLVLDADSFEPAPTPN